MEQKKSPKPPAPARRTSEPAKRPAGKRPAAKKPVQKGKEICISARAIRIAKAVLMDIALIGMGLLIFAYFHHVRPVRYDTSDVTVVQRPTAVPVQSAAPEVTSAPEATSTPIPEDWGTKFADRFASGATEWGESYYRSEDVSISITSHTWFADYSDDDPLCYYVADIYVRDIENVATYLASGGYAKGERDDTPILAQEANAILAVSGDYYGTREKGVVIRNGAVYRTSEFNDVCVLYYDGTMETYEADAFDVEEAIARGAYQAWSFGPQLLEDGERMTSFNSDVGPRNPRCAIGYYEPGHYCFVLVDGRQDGYSKGLTLTDLSALMDSMGCQAAYNLDGGQTAVMVFNGTVVNRPYKGGREVSDIVYIGEVTP